MRDGVRRLPLARVAQVLALALALGLLATAAAAAQAGPTKTGSLTGPFVALGDSFAAGDLIPVIPAGAQAGCLRSSHDYGADAAAALGLAYVDATCTGATTTDMTVPQHVTLGTHAPQFSYLAASDSVVTLTIGGDDIGFNGTLRTCAKLSLKVLIRDP